MMIQKVHSPAFFAIATLPPNVVFDLELARYRSDKDFTDEIMNHPNAYRPYMLFAGLGNHSPYSKRYGGYLLGYE
ncbi:hypothetical protein Tcan_14895 [Toxocara canis]|uniref:Uncharacterized protein n=1 Tax=Toxocara canis TaxID=6265 RepID=A0A0B2V673_TOXCA|nr:hypothetical protein Tcan_14895 [Toxocara canis]